MSTISRKEWDEMIRTGVRTRLVGEGENIQHMRNRATQKAKRKPAQQAEEVPETDLQRDPAQQAEEVPETDLRDPAQQAEEVPETDLRDPAQQAEEVPETDLQREPAQQAEERESRHTTTG
ncbi:hypothetical protein N7447_002908 [Penicillium robsamsonii]|uniref:uncharacterized protein n=1 Tax=Penicillium robsamsonii TaxID=1792511 RepID=UPI0025470C33|nr:uncharacterized protein N7447_002908 [Penicillium robsamsonii]KAJ5836882.1 hypothetical protein N7447_002908 [Penicillium robsamsonii]